MKKKRFIVQLILGAGFILLILVSGFHFSSLFFLASALLLIPTASIRNVLEKKGIKSWVLIVLAVFFLFVGILIMGNEKMENITNENHTSLSESIDDRDTSSKETSSKETSSKDTSSKDMSSKDSNDDSTAQVSVSAGNDVYKTPTGKRYHSDPDCGGKNSKKTTLNEAKSFGLTPCKKSAQ